MTLHNTPGDNISVKEYTFSGIDKTNYAALYNFLSGKKIRIKNIEGVGAPEEPASGGRAAARGAYAEMDMGGVEGEDSEEDEDYDQENQSESEEISADSEDDDELGSMASDDSDLAEHKKKSPGGAKKKKKKAKESSSAGKKRKASPTKKKKKKDP